MTSIKTLMLGLSAASLTIGGAAIAQPAGPGPRMERPVERPQADANRDRTITRAEAMDMAAKRFARMDANGDGKIDKADRELRQQQRKERIFARLDTNGDGSISKAEFMAPRAERGDHMGKAGKPGMGEHRKGGWRHGGMRRGHHGGMGMMKAADANGDGAISKAEFMAAAARRFDAQDANHDGKVTPEERQAARRAHMEERRAQWQARAAARADGSASN